MYSIKKYSRTISLNSHYHVVFKNRRDETQFRIFATQMLPHHNAWLLEANADAVTPEYGYMVIDNKPKTLETHHFELVYLVTKLQLFTRRKNSCS